MSPVFNNQQSFVDTPVLVTAVASLPGTIEGAGDMAVQETMGDPPPACLRRNSAEGCSGRWAASISVSIAKIGIGMGCVRRTSEEETHKK